MKIVWLDADGGTAREENLPEDQALARLESLLGFSGGALASGGGPCHDYNQETGVVTIFTPGDYCRDRHEDCRKNGCAKLQTA